MVKRSRRCYALYSGDTAAALLALGGSVRIASGSGVKTMPVEDFFVDDGLKNTVLQSGELMTGIVIPSQPASQQAAYLKYRKRGVIDYPLAGVAAAVDKDRNIIKSMRIAVTGVGSAPFLVTGLDRVVKDRTITENLVNSISELAWKQAHPLSRMDVSPSYRKHLVGVLTKDALNYVAGFDKAPPSARIKKIS
jgi:4-hydroxybenzoyl-CoA reductase subunit beta